MYCTKHHLSLSCFVSISKTQPSMVEPQRKKTYLLKCASNEVSNQPAHSRSLIRIFVVRIKTLGIFKYPKCAQGWFWLDCAKAQAYLNHRWAHKSEGTFRDVSVRFMHTTEGIRMTLTRTKYSSAETVTGWWSRAVPGRSPIVGNHVKIERILWLITEGSKRITSPSWTTMGTLLCPWIMHNFTALPKQGEYYTYPLIWRRFSLV